MVLLSFEQVELEWKKTADANISTSWRDIKMAPSTKQISSTYIEANCQIDLQLKIIALDCIDVIYMTDALIFIRGISQGCIYGNIQRFLNCYNSSYISPRIILGFILRFFQSIRKTRILISTGIIPYIQIRILHGIRSIIPPGIPTGVISGLLPGIPKGISPGIFSGFIQWFLPEFIPVFSQGFFLGFFHRFLTGFL